MKLWFYDDTSVEVDLRPEVVWDIWKQVKEGHLEARIRARTGVCAVWLDMRFLNADKTFGEAILAQHGQSIPPEAASIVFHDTDPPPSDDGA